MNTKQALKAAIASCDSKTGSGFADSDLIQLYDNQGNPNGKIARSALMDCVKTSLGTLMAGDNKGTSVDRVPALVSGALGSSSVADLASVLGGLLQGQEFVDLALPSGTLWAKCNLGAGKPEEYGAYFSWGNTDGHKPSGSTFSYNWGTSNSGTYAGTTGAGLTADITYPNDAAHGNFGAAWQMPSKDDFVELMDSSNTTLSWTTQNGVNGLLVTSVRNGNSIFFPAAGNGYGTSLNNAGSYGNYWSRSLQSSANGYNLSFGSSSVNPQYSNYRYYGFSVRAVSKDLPTFLQHYSTMAELGHALGVDRRMDFIDMGLPSGRLWASKNVGASTITEYGAYFSWGNVNGQKPNGTTFPSTWGTGNDTEPYVSSEGAALTGNIPLNLDAANQYLGGDVKMPSTEDFAELFNSAYTTNEWTTLHGVAGRMVTSKINGNKLFFPAAGYGYGTSLGNAGSYGDYWSRSLQSSPNGYNLRFDSSSVNPQNYDYRYYGFSVRAVL